MREILGYAPIEPDGSVRIEVPAEVAFEVSVLDANARRYRPDQGVWLQLKRGEVVSCNGCHTPAGAQQTQPGFSHGRFGTFASAWPGAAGGGAFPHTYASGPLAFIPQAGQTMAQARMAASCANDTPPCLQMMPSVNVLYTDVWTDPAQATPGTPVKYAYTDPSTSSVPAPPTTALCQTLWSSNCRIVINYPTIIQPIWDLATRTGTLNGVPGSNVTCSQAGCHNPLNAAAAAQTPAGNLDLTNSASNVVPEFTSYQQLLFPHNTVTMGPNGPITQTFGPVSECGQREWRAVGCVSEPLRNGCRKHTRGLAEPGGTSPVVGMAGYWRTVLQRPVRRLRPIERLLSPRGRRLLLAGALAVCFLTPGVAAARDYLQVFVRQPYLELHTGPGRGYPVFHAVPRDESVDVLFRRTDWFKVRTERGVEGWASQRDMLMTVLADGTPFTFDLGDRAGFTAHHFELGMFAGAYGGANLISAYGSRVVQFAAGAGSGGRAVPG